MASSTRSMIHRPAMKAILFCVLVLIAVASTAQDESESLGDIARRERQKKEAAGAVPQAAVRAEGDEAGAGTPTIRVNGRATTLPEAYAFPDPDHKGCVDVILSDAPVTADDVKFGMRLAERVQKGQLHYVRIGLDPSGQADSISAYHGDLSAGYISGGEVHFDRKTFDAHTVAGTVSSKVRLGPDAYELAGSFTAHLPAALPPVDQSSAAAKPSVKALLAFMRAANEGNTAAMRSYMAPELVQQWDATPAEAREMMVTLVKAQLEESGGAVLRVDETPNSAKITMGREEANSMTFNMVLVGGKWKVAKSD